MVELADSAGQWVTIIPPNTVYSVILCSGAGNTGNSDRFAITSSRYIPVAGCSTSVCGHAAIIIAGMDALSHTFTPEFAGIKDRLDSDWKCRV